MVGPTRHSFDQWCGTSEGEVEPIKDRLVEFAQQVWGNKGFGLMMNSIVCDKNFELCDPEHAVSTLRITSYSIFGCSIQSIVHDDSGIKLTKHFRPPHLEESVSRRRALPI